MFLKKSHKSFPMDVSKSRGGTDRFLSTLLSAISAQSWRSTQDQFVHKVFVWDRRGRYLDCQFPNPIHGHFLGGHLVKGQTVCDVLPNHAALVIQSGIRRVLRTQRPWEAEFDVSKTSTRYHVKMSFVPLGNHVLGLATDTPASVSPLVRPSRLISHAIWDSGEQSLVCTNQERTIIREVKQGYTNQAIAEHLHISERTVKFHLTNIYRKLGMTSRLQLMPWNPQATPRLSFLESHSD